MDLRLFSSLYYLYYKVCIEGFGGTGCFCCCWELSSGGGMNTRSNWMVWMSELWGESFIEKVDRSGAL